MPGELERIAYEAALRSLDKQETLLNELRARTGLILAAASVAASFLGRSGSSRVLATAAVGAFAVVVGCAVSFSCLSVC